MREVSGSAVYYQDSRYLEITIIFEDEESYLIDAVELVVISPMNARGYPLMPEPMVLTRLHGNVTTIDGNAAASLRGSIANIDYPSKIDVQLRDSDGVTYTTEIFSQNRDHRIDQIGPEINEDEIIQP